MPKGLGAIKSLGKAIKGKKAPTKSGGKGGGKKAAPPNKETINKPRGSALSILAAGGLGLAAGSILSAGNAEAVAEGERTTGPLSALEDNPYKFKHLSYPENVGLFGSRNPYYILFTIFASSTTNYTIPGATPKPRPSKIGESAPMFMEKVVNQFRRKSIKTDSAVRLYMPDTVSWNFNHSWNDISLTNEFANIGKAATLINQGEKALTQGTTQAAKDFVKGATTMAMESAAKSLKINESLATSMFGLAQNPNMEVLYNSPQFRTFNFEFVFAPRNAAEARAAFEIIQTFKFHAAPEAFSGGADLGRYFIPPSEFEIELKKGDGENLWQLGKITRCVLTDIAVDYGASGQFATFSDGMPTNIRMTLGFKETEFITKEMVAKGF